MDVDEDIIGYESDDDFDENFPVGLKVLCVDDDAVSLKVIEAMFRNNQYEVVACISPADAINLLRERNGAFDIILTDVHMPEMDGFQVLDIVKREFRIPVATMSVDDKVKIMARGLEAGACIHLRKPISINDVKNLWQFALKVGEIEPSRRRRSRRGSSSAHRMGNVQEGSSSVDEGNWRNKESKKKENRRDEGSGSGKDDTATTKKARIVWTPELHDQFLKAIDHLGIEKAVPKRILELMNVPGLSRENVASHLQKYRLFVKRLRVANEPIDPRAERFLGNGFIPGYPHSHPSMYNLPLGRPQYVARNHRQWTPIQPAFGGYNGSNNMAPVVAPSYNNQQALNVNNGVAQSRYDSWFGNASALITQEGLNNLDQVFGTRQTGGITINEPSTNVVNSDRHLMQTMRNQQTQMTQGYNADGTIDQNLTNLNLQERENLSFSGNSGIANMGSFGGWNPGANLDANCWNQGVNLDANHWNQGVNLDANRMNNSYMGGILTGLAGGSETLNTHYNQDQQKETDKGKRPMEAEEEAEEENVTNEFSAIINRGYTIEGAGSSSGVYANQFQTMTAPTLQPQEIQTQEVQDAGHEFSAIINRGYTIEGAGSSSGVYANQFQTMTAPTLQPQEIQTQEVQDAGHDSWEALLMTSPLTDMNNFLLSQGGQSPYPQQGIGGDGLMDMDFDFSAFQMDGNGSGM